jgi:hypothetical protein
LTAIPDNRKLPLWRLIAGLFVFVSLIGVLLALAPVYFDNFQLQRYMRELTRNPGAAATPDDVVRSEVLERARQLNLPVDQGEIQIAHAGGKLQLQMKYAVEMTLPLYRVDLHFHPSASEP